jgi:predicted nucleic acid-binding protein
MILSCILPKRRSPQLARRCGETFRGNCLNNGDRATVPEMPDRIIAATALHLGCPLVTSQQSGKLSS